MSIKVARQSVAAALVLVAEMGTAACGGAGGAPYVAEATMTCLQKEGFSNFSTAAKDLDLIAEKYEGRAAVFHADGGEVTVIVAENESQAKNAAAGYEAFSGAVRDATIKREKNAVIAAGALEDSTLARIESCLSNAAD